MNPIKSILLVDDDQDYKFFFYKALNNVDPGIEITSASDGLDAFSKLKERKPDMIILDYNMPRMNAVTFLKEIKSLETYKYIPVVIYSTFISMFNEEELIQLGAHHVYIKPSEFSDTEKIITAILNINGVKKCA